MKKKTGFSKTRPESIFDLMRQKEDHKRKAARKKGRAASKARKRNRR